MSLSSELIPFLLEANQFGYAGDDPVIERFDDGGKQIHYSSGDLSFRDYWWGGNPFAGQQSISRDGNVMWAMQYRGSVESKHSDKTAETFDFLRRVLRLANLAEPIRGPERFQADDFTYQNAWGMTLDDFRGRERIWYKTDNVYTGMYFGGAIGI
jgi:hypothetical protein